MGTLTYGESNTTEIDDRALFHLQIVAGLKLRRREGFYLTLRARVGEPQRITMWVDPSIPLVFTYQDERPLQVNKVWLDVLVDSSNSANGLALIAEDAEEVTRLL